MGIYITNSKTGTRKQLFGAKAVVAGFFLAFFAAAAFGLGFFLIFCAPFFAGVAIIGGIVDMVFVGFNFWNIFWVVAGVLFFYFYRLYFYRLHFNN